MPTARKRVQSCRIKDISSYGQSNDQIDVKLSPELVRETEQCQVVGVNNQSCINQVLFKMRFEHERMYAL